jgi:hypothetical protein
MATSGSGASGTTKRLASDLNRAQENLEEKTQPDVALPSEYAPQGAEQTEAQKASFPAQYGSMSEPPILKKQAYYDQIAKQMGGTVPASNVTIPFTDKDVEEIEEKQRITELANFHTWIQKNFPVFTDPQTQRHMRQIYPEFYSMREQQMKETIEMQTKAQMIALNGFQNIDELYFLFQLSTNEDLAKTLATPIGAREGGTVEETARYQRSMWNTKRRVRNKATSEVAFAGVGSLGGVTDVASGDSGLGNFSNVATLGRFARPPPTFFGRG